MIILLGATGYVGSNFARALDRRQIKYLPLDVKDVDAAKFEDVLRRLARRE